MPRPPGRGRSRRCAVIGWPPPHDRPGVVVEEREQIRLAPADGRPVQRVAGPQLVRAIGLEPAEHRFAARAASRERPE